MMAGKDQGDDDTDKRQGERVRENAPFVKSKRDSIGRLTRVSAALRQAQGEPHPTC